MKIKNDLKFSPFLADQNMIANRAANLRPSLVRKTSKDFTEKKVGEVFPFSESYKPNNELTLDSKRKNNNQSLQHKNNKSMGKLLEVNNSLKITGCCNNNKPIIENEISNSNHQTIITRDNPKTKRNLRDYRQKYLSGIGNFIESDTFQDHIPLKDRNLRIESQKVERYVCFLIQIFFNKCLYSQRQSMDDSESKFKDRRILSSQWNLENNLPILRKFPIKTKEILIIKYSPEVIDF